MSQGPPIRRRQLLQGGVLTSFGYLPQIEQTEGKRSIEYYQGVIERLSWVA